MLLHDSDVTLVCCGPAEWVRAPKRPGCVSDGAQSRVITLPFDGHRLLTRWRVGWFSLAPNRAVSDLRVLPPTSCVMIVALLVRGLPMAQNRLGYRVGMGAPARQTGLNPVSTSWWV